MGRPGQEGSARADCGWRAWLGSLCPAQQLNSTLHTFTVVNFSCSEGYRHLRSIRNVYSLLPPFQTIRGKSRMLEKDLLKYKHAENITGLSIQETQDTGSRIQVVGYRW